MSILACIVVSLISGFIDSKLVNKTGEGLTRGLGNWELLSLEKPNSCFPGRKTAARTK